MKVYIWFKKRASIPLAPCTVNVTLLLGVSSMALILTTDREKLNNLERKIIKSTCCRKEYGNQPKRGNNSAHLCNKYTFEGTRYEENI
jgi:hypothetical protein